MDKPLRIPGMHMMHFHLCGGSLLGFGEELNVGAPDRQRWIRKEISSRWDPRGKRIGHQG